MFLNSFSRRCLRESRSVIPSTRRFAVVGQKHGAETIRLRQCKVTYDGDAPLLTCAPTGAGKGRGVLIPKLLSYPGP